MILEILFLLSFITTLIHFDFQRRYTGYENYKNANTNWHASIDSK